MKIRILTRGLVPLLVILGALALVVAITRDRGGSTPTAASAATLSTTPDNSLNASATAGSALAVANQAAAMSSIKPSKIPSVVDQFAAQVAAARAHGRSAAELSNLLVHSTKDGRIELVFHARGQVGSAQTRDLKSLGASIVTTVSEPSIRGNPAVGLIQAKVPYNRIGDAARLGWVVAVTPPGYGIPDVGPNNSQGVALHRANQVQTRGINGTGVNVGVISNGVTTIATSQAAGELPNTVNVLNTGSGDEGTAMLEIVQDMAPGAGLLFDATGGSVATHVNALNNLVTNGANVITEDIPFDAEPAFQQGLAATTAENIATAGVPVHSSAGNLGQRHAARVTATGTGGGPDGISPSGPPTGCANNPDNAVAIAPGADTTFDVTLGASNSFTLQWSEPRAIFPSAGQGGFTDLNLYVMNAALTQCIAQSTTVQGNGQGDTIEQIAFNGMNGVAAKLVVDVQGTSTAVAAPLLDLRWRGAGATDTPTRAGSLNPDSNYTGLATSAAALDAQNSGAIEGYSAGGPVQLVTTTQCPGGGAGPCTGVAGSSSTSGAPTWGAADDVSVSGVGGFGSPFSGTSAAAPHAAACDALLRDALNNASAAVATTNARLAATAVDVAPAGTDNVTGAGQLDCLAAVNNAPIANAGGPYSTPEGTNVTLDASGSADVDIPLGDTLTYSWDLNNDSVFGDATGVSPTFTSVGQDGAYPVAVLVTDNAGATSTASSTVTVNNVAPSVTVGSNGPKPENSPVTVSGLVSDPGWLDPLSATIDWGDGSPVTSVAGTLENVRPDATFTYSASHTYGDDGTFTVKVCGSDDDTSTCNTTPVVITNVAPTAVIDETGALVVNGVPTFIAHAGQTLTFKGRSQDPGSDDLALTWNWADGSPSVTTNYLVNPPFTDPDPSPSIQPRDVLDTKTHVFGSACLYTIGFSSLDDDAGSASDTANVAIFGNADKSKESGWWQVEYKKPDKSKLGVPTLTCYLSLVGYLSSVFNEANNASTLALAADVLKPPSTGEKPIDQFDRRLMTTWLNIVNGAVEYTNLVDTDGNGVPDTSVGAAMASIEVVRLTPGVTKKQLEDQTKLLKKIDKVDLN
jgi:hypothetical protein